MITPWRVISSCLAVALVIYFFYYATRSLDLATLREAVASPAMAFAIFGAAVLYATIVPITAWAWQKLLAIQGERWTVRSLSLILGISQLAKYIPGNVAQHVARTAISVQLGIKPKSVLVTVAQEILLAVAASLIVGVVALVLSGQGLGYLSSASDALLIFAGVLVLLVGVLASVRLDPVKLGTREGPVWRIMTALGGLPGPAVTLWALFAYAMNYLIIGGGLWLVTSAMGVGDQLGLLVVTSVFSLSWVLGFLAPGAPAGLGAREAIMLILLHDTAESQDLLIFVVLARLVTMLGDAICFFGAVTGKLWADRAGKFHG